MKSYFLSAKPTSKSPVRKQLFMLQRSGPFDEEELITALKSYLPLYGKTEKEICEVPYRDVDLGRVMKAQFMWLAEQWIFIESK